MTTIIDWFEAEEVEDGKYLLTGCSQFGGHNQCTEEECTGCPYAHTSVEEEDV